MSGNPHKNINPEQHKALVIRSGCLKRNSDIIQKRSEARKYLMVFAPVETEPRSSMGIYMYDAEESQSAAKKGIVIGNPPKIPALDTKKSAKEMGISFHCGSLNMLRVFLVFVCSFSILIPPDNFILYKLYLLLYHYI